MDLDSGAANARASAKTGGATTGLDHTAFLRRLALNNYVVAVNIERSTAHLRNGIELVFDESGESLQVRNPANGAVMQFATDPASGHLQVKITDPGMDDALVREAEQLLAKVLGSAPASTPLAPRSAKVQR